MEFEVSTSAHLLYAEYINLIFSPTLSTFVRLISLGLYVFFSWDLQMNFPSPKAQIYHFSTKDWSGSYSSGCVIISVWFYPAAISTILRSSNFGISIIQSSFIKFCSLTLSLNFTPSWPWSLFPQTAISPPAKSIITWLSPRAILTTFFETSLNYSGIKVI